MYITLIKGLKLLTSLSGNQTYSLFDNMAYLLTRFYEGYLYLMEEVSDPRSRNYPFVSTPFPTLVLLYFWYQFVFKWGPEYMKNREPFNIKPIMIVYNVLQVLVNFYIFYYCCLSANELDWNCAVVDYSESYWGRKHLQLSLYYYMLKIADLLDTVFFILRKKSTHVSFLHTYHHALMVMTGWLGVRFLGGGHSYFIGFANTFVHTILYSYYLLTAYDSKYGQLIWLKKLITQAQLAQFAFLFVSYLRVLFVRDCGYPKFALFLLIPQNAFMTVLFSDFYIKTYLTAPKMKNQTKEQLIR